jgi:hypothetical protein
MMETPAEASSQQPSQQHDSPPTRTIKVDFSWKKFQALISEQHSSESKHICTVEYKAFKPQLVFKSVPDNSTIGTGALHAISINAECEVHGQPVILKAQKRFKTSYMHLSHAFSDNDAAVPMTWTSSSGFKTWDFICLDPQQIPVAKFSLHMWAAKRFGSIEMMGSRAMTSDAARDEIIIVGLTLVTCMELRVNNPLSLFGAIFSRPGHDAKDTPTVPPQDGTSSIGDHKIPDESRNDANPHGG